MSIVTGLIQAEATEVQQTSQGSAFGEWIIQHSWAVILTGSLAFWLILAAALIWL